MDKLITLCRDVEEPATTDCIDDHEDLDRPLIAPCRVERGTCGLPAAEEEPVGAEAESSATNQDEMTITDCCDC